MRGIVAGAIIQTDPDQKRDNVVRRQQREESDKRQSLDPATRAANVARDQGRSPDREAFDTRH